MPCNLCKYIYRLPPCSSKLFDDPIIIGSEHHDEIAKYSLATINYWTQVFRVLKIHCPCQECLVKVMCQARCERYKDVLESDNKFLKEIFKIMEGRIG